MTNRAIRFPLLKYFIQLVDIRLSLTREHYPETGSALKQALGAKDHRC